MRFFLIILFFFSLNSVNSCLALDYILKHEGHQVVIPFNKVDGLLVNDICKEKGSRCLALRAAKFKGKRVPYPKKNLGSPAQDFCGAIGGTALTLLKSDQSGVSFCSFEDQTIISSWDLFNTRLTKKRAK